MKSLLSPLFNAVTQSLNQLLPAPCLLCGSKHTRDLTLLCADCVDALPTLKTHPYRCHCCALPLTSEATHCGQCVAHPPAFTRTLVPFLYEHPLDGLIHQFKYRRQLASGKLLSELLLQDIQQEAVLPDVLVPAPIHWRKRWQRGFNQTEILALALGKALQIPISYACLQPTPTHSQKGLSRIDRLNNSRRRFAINPKSKPQIAGAHVALIDDVVTTTATARMLSELLIAAGAKQVDIWALARTPDY